MAFLTAAKSMKRKFIGKMAKIMGAVSVSRAMDETKSVPGKIYLPDPDNDPTLIRGVDTNFEEKSFQIGGLLVLPKVKGEAANTEISEIISPTEMRLKKAFRGEVALGQLTGRTVVIPDGKTKADMPVEFNGTSFRVAPKIDQEQVYQRVSDTLGEGGCIGMFPEGGSHDRTELLPLKGMSCLTSGAMELILYSWRGTHGVRDARQISRLWIESGSRRNELLSRSQIQISVCY